MNTIEQPRYLKIENDRQMKIVESVLNADPVELEAMTIIVKALQDGLPPRDAAKAAVEFLKQYPDFEKRANTLIHFLTDSEE